jgi:hypothetical protein
MVPASYDAYFTTAATAAATLIGLLFVAVSLRGRNLLGGPAPGGPAARIASRIVRPLREQQGKETPGDTGPA